VIIACTVLIQITSVTADGQTDGRTPRRWLRRAKHSAFARKNPSQSYRGVTICGRPYGITRCYLPPGTWTCAAIIQARQAGASFTHPGGMEGWVDLGVGYIPRWFTCLQTATHPSSITNHLIATWLQEWIGTELTIASLTCWPHGFGLGRDVSVSRRSRDVLTSRLGLVSGLGLLRLVETFCAGARRAYCSYSYSDTNQHMA